MYKKPLQSRAITTETRFLDALNDLLKEKSLGQLTVDQIAEHTHLTRGAFFKRFGSKKQALFFLWERYSERSKALKEQLANKLALYPCALDACIGISQEIEAFQRVNFSANRAMHEDFQEELKINPITKKIFLEGVDLMHQVRQRFMDENSPKDERDFAAAQLIISLNYNYVLKALPGLPENPQRRHHLIGRLAIEAMRDE